jgi:hypothetical protein
MHSMKGQTRIFEEVLLFGVSIAIFVTCLSIFQLYQEHFGFVSLNDQAVAIGNIVQGNLIEMARLGDANASVIVTIPRVLSGESYLIKLNDTDVTITTKKRGFVYMGRLQMIGKDIGGSFSLSGEAASSRGQIIIYKKGDNIILE